ncbi:MAG TPA: glycoside hydrolase family 97 protein [Longimicrobiales bacterium]
MPAIAFLLAAMLAAPQSAQDTFKVSSPDGRNVVTVGVQQGQLYYALQRDGRDILLPSRLGFALRNAAPLRDTLRIVAAKRDSADLTWEQPWGEVSHVRDHHRELRVSVQEQTAAARKFDVVFRVFDDGIGFRYDFPAQPNLGQFEIMDELTEFSFADNPRAWWIASNRPRLDRSEQLYSAGPLSTLDSVQTPLTMESTDGRTAIVIHEADLVDYPRMFLAGRGMESRVLHAALAPWVDGVKVRGRTPFKTPWRTIQLADGVATLVPAVLGLNLNQPSVIAKTDWIKPMKYVGIWWGMHINTWTWSSGAKHGATTANAKRYIDFAAANGLGGVLVEGWNTGWDGDWIDNRNAFSFTKAYPDYDLKGVAEYARRKGVQLIVHNETSGGIANYERQLDSAFTLYQSLGAHAIKTGYVTDTLGGGNSHFGQFAVRHHRLVIEKAAQHQIMVDAHEPVHDTGERRTYPNMMTREGSRGQEYNAWGGEGGNPPEHETILFFTRLLAGPMDFTPGIFDLWIQKQNGTPRRFEEAHVRTTLAKQLALYVVLYSPLQMAADMIENYQNEPAFQFIRDVAVDWEQTRVLDASIGDYVVVARQQRNSDDWFIGAITDEKARTFDVPLSFLPAGKTYVADIYADGAGANWLTNPLPVAISHQTVTAASRLKLDLAAGGGQAIRLHAVR